MYSIFVCEAYFTSQVEQIEALNENEAIEIFKEMTGESVVKCKQIA